jgi:hypothetical protein
MPNNARTTRGDLSLAIAFLALLVALSGPAHAALGKGAVKAKHLADGAVKTAKISDAAVTSPKLGNGSVTTQKLGDGAVVSAKLADGSVVASKLADGSVDTDAIVDRTIRLRDLGGGLVDQTTTTGSAIAIAAGDCHNLSLRTENPAPAGWLGSMVVGTITTAGGGAVVNNLGAVLPTLLTATSQGGVVVHLTVCAGSSAQTIPVGSVVTWSLVAP